MKDLIESIVDVVKLKTHPLTLFMNNVHEYFSLHPDLISGSPSIVHSVRSRLKNHDHLRAKLLRKLTDGRSITPDNIFEEITDLAGVRVLHLHQDQFPTIHNAITDHMDAGGWVLHEDPKAYTWDPESELILRGLGFEVTCRDTLYTSVHYVVRPNLNSPIRCEIQVRTLFEEVWGEIDHSINYPQKTEFLACREQLKVLAKLVGTGTRLADSIFRTHIDCQKGKVHVPS